MTVHKFKIRKSNIEGRGAFATELIKKDELICKMEGEEMDIVELKRRYESGEERETDPLQVTAKTYLDLEEPYVLINHSCEPNAAMVKFNDLVALRDIRPGEEITYDYALTDWSDDADWPGYDDWLFECHCGVPSCRGKISELRYMPAAVQAKHVLSGYLQDYMIKKYKEVNKT